MVGFVSCQDETATEVSINLINPAFSEPMPASDPCPESTASTVLEIVQNEDITDDWMWSEPCACSGTAESAEAFWEAEFDGDNKYDVNQVRILVRHRYEYSYTWDYMRGIKIFIDETECHTVADDGALNGVWYEFECDNGPIRGDKISLRQQRESKIFFCGIEVKGTEFVPLIPTCDWSQEEWWTDGLCTSELFAYIIFFGIVGGFFALVITLIIVAVV